MIIQASSSESERSFSDLGNILTSKRCRMKGDLVNAIVIINSFLNSSRYIHVNNNKLVKFHCKKLNIIHLVYKL